MVGIYDIEIYEFEFHKRGALPAVPDKRIGCTIATLLWSFFINPSRVIVYVCDAFDGKETGRARLFGMWHTVYLSDLTRTAPVDINLEDETGILTTIHGGVLIRHDFPHYGVLRDEVLINAHEILLNKYEG